MLFCQKTSLWDAFSRSLDGFVKQPTPEKVDQVWQSYDALKDEFEKRLPPDLKRFKAERPTGNVDPLWMDQAHKRLRTVYDHANERVISLFRPGYEERFEGPLWQSFFKAYRAFANQPVGATVGAMRAKAQDLWRTYDDLEHEVKRRAQVHDELVLAWLEKARIKIKDLYERSSDSVKKALHDGYMQRPQVLKRTFERPSVVKKEDKKASTPTEEEDEFAFLKELGGE